MKNTPGNRIQNLVLGIALLCLIPFSKSYAQFTTGNIVVEQVSDGNASLINSGNGIFLREFTPAGTPAFSVAVPSTGTNALVVSGVATSEGALSLSANSKYLVFGGYATTTVNATSLASSVSSNIQRAVCVVNASGTYSMVANSSTFHSGNNIRAAASDGNNNYWTAGGNDGTDYFGLISPTVNVQNATTNTRCVNIFSNSLYFSTGSGTSKGIYKVGTGLPVTTGQTNSLTVDVTNSGSGTASPYAFFFNPSQTICYIADDRSVSNGGGIQKWVYSASSWTLAYVIGTGSASTVGARGLVADFSGTSPVIYATTAESTNNRLISVVDAGSASSPTTIATSSNTAIFRGLAFSPSPACSTPTITSVVSNGTICTGQTLSLSAAVSGTALVTYSWTGTGTISTPTSSNVTVTGAISGNYMVVATNTCGSSFSALTVTVVTGPSVTINSSGTSVCPGQTVALTASGASSYTWSNGFTNGGAFTPTASAVYTVNASNGSCVSTSTVTIPLNPLPALNAGSITICAGQPGTLTASGASSYSWSTGSTAASISVTPVSTQIYTITGTSAGGCALTLTTQAAVTSSPSVVVNSSTVCAGSSATLVAGGANSFTWSTGASTSSLVVAPATSTVYTVSGSLVGCAGTSSNTASVSIIAVPLISVSGNTTSCANSAVSQTLSGAASYSVNGSQSNTVISLTPSVTTVYSVTGASASGCRSTLTETITISPLPVLSVAGSTAACSGIPVTQTLSGAANYSLNGAASASVVTLMPGSAPGFSIVGISASGCTAILALTVAAIPAPTVSISGNNAVCAGSAVSQTLSGAGSYSLNGASSSSVLSFTPTGNYSYTVTGKNSSGCIGSTTSTITVNALPVISLNSSASTICTGSSATLTASGASSYSWTAGAGSGAVIMVTPSTTTTYSVTGSNAGNCSSGAQFVQNVTICNSIAELGKQSETALYPNPASSFVTVDNLNGDRNEVRFVNALGSMVLLEKNYNSAKQVDISGLPNGVYFVQILSNGKISVKKLVIDKP